MNIPRHSSLILLVTMLGACAPDADGVTEALYDDQAPKADSPSIEGRLQPLPSALKDGQVITIRNAASGKCLDASDWGNGIDVIQYECHGKNNQKWQVMVYNDGTIALANDFSKKCLDASDWGKGTNVIQYGCHDGPNQRWHYRFSGNGRASLVNLASGKCLDASDYGKGTAVIQYDCGPQSNQQWY